MTTFESEASIEEKLIQQLVEGESQWTFRGDIHTFDDLWNNFRKISSYLIVINEFINYSVMIYLQKHIKKQPMLYLA